MAPIKFEEQLKDKLEKRSLQPSADGWTKLSKRLDAEEKKSKNPWFFWIGIAASLVIMITITVQFFNKEEVEEVVPVIVEEGTKEKQLELKFPVTADKETKSLVVEETSADMQKENQPKIEQSEIIDYKKVVKDNSKKDNRLVENEENGINKIEAKDASNEVAIIIDESIIKDAIANTINELKSGDTSLVDREVDSLLKLASKELFKEKLQEEVTKTVDASALLISIEDELGQSFRTKVFEALKESYETVKTAVAERNN